MPRSTDTVWRDDVPDPDARPMDQAPGASDSVTVPLTVMARTLARVSELGGAAGDAAPRPGPGTAARLPSAMRKASSRRRSESRLDRTASAATVRRRMAAYWVAYARVVRSAVSSIRTSRSSVSRNARKRASSIATLSRMLISRAALSPAIAVAPGAAGDAARGATGIATTSTGSPRMVESITTMTSPDRAHPTAMTANTSATMPRCAARGRF